MSTTLPTTLAALPVSKHQRQWYGDDTGDKTSFNAMAMTPATKQMSESRPRHWPRHQCYCHGFDTCENINVIVLATTVATTLQTTLSTTLQATLLTTLATVLAVILVVTPMKTLAAAPATAPVVALATILAVTFWKTPITVSSRRHWWQNRPWHWRGYWRVY